MISALALGVNEAIACQSIEDFVKDIESNRSELLPSAAFTLVDVAKPYQFRTVRRYAIHLPSSVPEEIMQLEIVDDDRPHSKPRQDDTGTRYLRIRPHSVSHWIDVGVSAVTLDIYDHITGCPRTKSELCGGFGIHFESKDAAIEIGFLTYIKDDKHHVDQVILTVRERWCTEPDMFSK